MKFQNVRNWRKDRRVRNIAAARQRDDRRRWRRLSKLLLPHYRRWQEPEDSDD